MRIYAMYMRSRMVLTLLSISFLATARLVIAVGVTVLGPESGIFVSTCCYYAEAIAYRTSNSCYQVSMYAVRALTQRPIFTGKRHPGVLHHLCPAICSCRWTFRSACAGNVKDAASVAS
jgi:hypothetical protein